MRASVAAGFAAQATAVAFRDRCRRELDEALAEHAEPVALLTATLCEDFQTCLVVVELVDHTLLARSFDWPLGAPFNEDDILAELRRLSPPGSVH